ncbi:MAG: VWA domain-containing protein [Desulfobacterales bacterium]|nr:VWA domain-containing protein [Desulfobacterales bacterium]MDD4072582.1 VWA domain-containing protein [Desulfobacterales bacterium]MDD4391994.1 VWA domain-containing protein [Desulfobacterales bacterium]
MKFVRIEMLFLIWVVPVLLLVCILGMRKRRAVLSKFSSLKGLSCIVPDAAGKRRWVKTFLMLCVVMFASVALSGPQYGYKWQEIERKGIDIIIALDCSRSMLADDIKPTRLDRAKREVFDLLNMLRGDRVGLVAFAGTAFLQCPLTLDYEAFNLFLNTLTPDFLPIGGTDLPAALDTASAAFNTQDRSEKAILLITDGESTGENPEETAQRLKKAGVKLFCVGVGKPEGVPVPDPKGGFKKDASGSIVLTRLDEKTLQTLSVLTGGAYVRSVAGDMDLDVIYSREIRGKMEASTVSGGRKQVWEDRYQWPLALAIIAFIIELFLPSVRAGVAIVVMGMVLLNGPVAEAQSLNRSLQNGVKAYETGEYETALKQFIDAQLKAPDRPELYYNIGNTYYRIDDFESAGQNYKQALSSENPQIRQKAYYNLGNVQYRTGNYPEAVSSYEQALKLDPNDEQASANMQFVKKVMQQQKEQKSPPGSNDGSKQKKKEGDASENPDRGAGDKPQEGQPSGDKENSSDKKNTSGSGQQQNENEQDVPDYGSRMNDDRKPEPQSKAGPAGRPDDKTGDDRQQSSGQGTAAQARDAKEDPNENGQAERLLNRLKDMPGKAMVPIYQKRQVEKDW